MKKYYHSFAYKKWKQCQTVVKALRKWMGLDAEAVKLEGVYLDSADWHNGLLGLFGVPDTAVAFWTWKLRVLKFHPKKVEKNLLLKDTCTIYFKPPLKMMKKLAAAYADRF